MSAHTPGPWEVEVINDSGGGQRLQVAASCSTGRVAVLSRVDEASANARLIAAAPDLLEALMELADLAQGLDVTFSDWKEESDAEAVLSQARAAIAKATGGDR